MAVIVANLTDDIRVACRNHMRRHYGEAVMGRPLGAGGYLMSVADVGTLVRTVVEELRRDPDYDQYRQHIVVTGGAAVAALQGGSLSGAADYIGKEVLKRLKAAGVELKA